MTNYNALVDYIHAQPLHHVIVFDGYSGLGYAHPEKVFSAQYEEMKEKAQALNSLSEAIGLRAPLFVVAGATADGIGMCYDVADKLKAEGFDIELVGIVSSAATIEESWGKALPDVQAKRMDHLLVVDDPKQTWLVLNERGESLMVQIALATQSASVSFYGGGAVANSELVELSYALANNSDASVNVTIRHGDGDFAPRADKAEKKYQQVLQKSLANGMPAGVAARQAALEINGTAAYQAGTSKCPQLVGSAIGSELATDDQFM